MALIPSISPQEPRAVNDSANAGRLCVMAAKVTAETQIAPIIASDPIPAMKIDNPVRIGEWWRCMKPAAPRSIGATMAGAEAMAYHNHSHTEVAATHAIGFVMLLCTRSRRLNRDIRAGTRPSTSLRTLSFVGWV